MAWPITKRPQEAGNKKGESPSLRVKCRYMWFMDCFNLQATCLSLERFAASIKVSRAIKTAYRRYFPWCFPPAEFCVALETRLEVLYFS